MKSIKNIVFVTLFTFIFSLSTLVAQNDTMYVMKDGNVTHKISIKTADVDSVIFFKPTTETTVTDFDGNVYNTATIGTQVWMAENLRVTHYADGTPIPKVSDTTVWDALTSTDKAYCWYNNDSTTNASQYGALYTWLAAMNGAASSTVNPSGIQGVCPTGWHLPSDAEWTQMENYLADNGYNYDGTTGGGRDKIAKSLASTSGWTSSSTTGAVGNTDYPEYRNKSGFTALPDGRRLSNGSFLNIGSIVFWWSATESNVTNAWYRNMYYYNSVVYRYSNEKEAGFSVRCVMDY